MGTIYFLGGAIPSKMIALSLLALLLIIIFVICGRQLKKKHQIKSQIYERLSKRFTKRYSERQQQPEKRQKDLDKSSTIHLNTFELNSDFPNSPIVLKRKSTLSKRLKGNPNIVDESKDMKSQVQLISYNKKREIEKSSFELTTMMGSGCFGTVYKGTLYGLYGKDTKTVVAIKSLTDTTELSKIENFLDEIKIMSILDPHLNLVNMIGSCTSDYIVNGSLWLILQFCNHGDLKKFLIQNRNKILQNSSSENNFMFINTRCLLLWIYGIAQGMKFLSHNRIMHGDLAARNILLCEDPFETQYLVPKIADFGLSKKFNDLERYDKIARPHVPWKWMAIEFLKNNFFTLNSDVWSFAVVVWEVLSLGKDPYLYQDVFTVIDNLEQGYRLPLPEECRAIDSWSPQTLYTNLINGCFVADPLKRASFSEVVSIIEKQLTEEEKDTHLHMNTIHQFVRESNYMEIRRNGLVQSNK